MMSSEPFRRWMAQFQRSILSAPKGTMLVRFWARRRILAKSADAGTYSLLAGIRPDTTLRPAKPIGAHG
jgi:hypothetical protein